MQELSSLSWILLYTISGIFVSAYLLTRSLSAKTYADINDEHSATSRFSAVRAALQLTRFIEGRYLQASLAQRILKMSHDQTVQPGPVNGGLEQGLDTHQDEGRRFTFLIVNNNSGVIVLDTQTRHVFWEYHPPARGYPNGPVDVVDIGMDDAAGGGSLVLVITLADAYDTEYVEVFYLSAADCHDQWDAELVYSQELFFAHDESAARFTHVLWRAQCALLFATRGRRIVLVDWENRRVACVFTSSSTFILNAILSYGYLVLLLISEGVYDDVGPCLEFVLIHVGDIWSEAAMASNGSRSAGQSVQLDGLVTETFWFE